MFELVEEEKMVARIKVVGVGGGGGNAINSMVATSLLGVEFIAVNTDNQHLEESLAPLKVQIGREITKGLGAGANPSIGRQAALEDRETLISCMDGADMVFITAGMGGGTGTGASPVIAAVAKELRILTVAVVTRPFYYEGRKRAINAEEGIRELRKNVDTLIVIPNDRIHLVVEKGTPLLKSFSVANEVLKQAIQGISDLIVVPGLINLDFADVKTVMENAGKAVIGTGMGKGENAAFEAAKKAISNPLLEETSIEGAKGILINITGGLTMSLDTVQDAASLIHDSAHEDANIILGAVINADMDDEVRVTVIATGLDEPVEKPEIPSIKKWAPKREPFGLKASERLLSKSIDFPSRAPSGKSEEIALPSPPRVGSSSSGEQDAAGVPEQQGPADVSPGSEIDPPKDATPDFPVEDMYDIPTFLRKERGN
ncbi:MAG TPA: cell division protein FtsZ [Dissulfurispiraceae bacterium]|nr:cell division protein FtsZ [Dissulfurispiraceae bacterium]